MAPGRPLRTIAGLIATALLLLVLGAPAVAAQPPEVGSAKCEPEPLGHPDPDGGLDDDIKAFGNPVISGACVLVLNVAGDAVVLAVNAVNLVCDFATGDPCIGVQDE